MEAREIRIQAGKSQGWCAFQSGTSEPTVRLYEANPTAVRNPKKRDALKRVYESLAADGARSSSPSEANR